MEGVTKYLLYRDTTELVYSGSDTFAEDSAITTGTTYSYQIRVQNADGSLSIASEPTTYAVPSSSTTVADELQCSGVKGYIRLNGYANKQTRQWRITPASPTGIIMKVRAWVQACRCTSVC